MWQHYYTVMSTQLSDRWKGWQDWVLPLHPKAVMLGSCFSVEVAQRCIAHNWNVLSNPMGTLFQPLSILNWLKGDLAVLGQSIVFHEEKWKMLMAGKVGQSNLSKEALQQWAKSVISDLHESILSSQVLVITWGTAHAWKWKQGDMAIGNCQRLPQQDFDKMWLTTSEILDAYKQWFNVFQSQFPNVKVVLTVSPVRHEKLGVIENSRSKAILIEAAHQLSEQTSMRYFPSYEWVQDELRDYTYYEKDGCHPNAHAIDFVAQHWFKSFGYE